MQLSLASSEVLCSMTLTASVAWLVRANSPHTPALRRHPALENIVSVHRILSLCVVVGQQAPTWEVRVHVTEARVELHPELDKLTQAGTCIEVVPQHCCIIAWQGTFTPCQHLVLHIILLLPHLHLYQYTCLISVLFCFMPLIMAVSSFTLPVCFDFVSVHPLSARRCRQRASMLCFKAVSLWLRCGWEAVEYGSMSYQLNLCQTDMHADGLPRACAQRQCTHHRRSCATGMTALLAV